MFLKIQEKESPIVVHTTISNSIAVQQRKLSWETLSENHLRLVSVLPIPICQSSSPIIYKSRKGNDNMAINQNQKKISTLAKDFNMKSKDVIDILAAAGMDKKTSGTIDSDEFSVFLDKITTDNQISNMSEYLSGKADIQRGVKSPVSTEKGETNVKETPVKNSAPKTKEVTPKAADTSGESTEKQSPKETAKKEAPAKHPVSEETKNQEKPTQILVRRI